MLGLDSLAMALLGVATKSVAGVLFRLGPNDLPYCNTRILPGNRGWPWDRKVAIHTTEYGKTEIFLLEPTKTVENE